MTAQTSHPAGPLREPLRAEGWRRLESVFVFLFFLTYAGQLAPAVNEAHYLCKARHYWDPTWCPNDQFMNSADTHLAFYWTFGWLTQVASLPVTAWLGRLVVWAMLTCGWMSLARAVCPIPGTALLGAALATALAELTNLAGEWCVGGVEGKVVAWALVLGASGCVIRDQWRVVWPLLGTAIAFHALVGGWAWLICVGVLYWSQRCEGGSLRTTLLMLVRMWPSVLVGLAAAAVGLWPALLMDWQSPPDVRAAAHAIQVHERLPHHLLLAGMKWYRQLRFGLLVGVWFAVSGVSLSPPLLRLRWLVNGSLAIAIGGALVELAEACTGISMASLQRFYWFRMSDVLVPIGVVLVTMVRAIEFPHVSGRARQRALTLALLALVVWIPSRFIYLRLDRRPHAVRQARPFRFRQRKRIAARYADWRAVCDWIREQTPTDATFITPSTRQTFKWFADRGELATWKGMPQDAESILEWKARRNALAATGLTDPDVPIDPQRIEQLARRYGLTHLLIEGQSALLPSFPLIYRNDHFQLYRLVRVPPADGALGVSGQL